VAFVQKPGGWWRAGDPENDPFFLGQALDDLEARIADAVGTSSETTVYGNDVIGGTSGALTINHSTVIAITLPGPGTVTLEGYVAGDGGSVGSVALRGVVYDGVDPTSARISQGVPVAVADGDPAAWVTVGEDMEVNAGTQYVGYQVGGTNGVATYRKDIGPLGSCYFNNDTYSDGAAATFGTATADTAIPSIRATFTPSPAAAIGGLTVQNQGVQVGAQQAATTLNVSGATVTLDLASGVATITVTGSDTPTSTVTSYVLGNYPLPASAVVDSGPLTATQISAAAAGDQNFASLLVEDSLDASTWRTRASGGSAATFMNASGVSSWTYMHALLTNGAVAQTDFQFDLSVTS
jgi:hypothetical protein